MVATRIMPPASGMWVGRRHGGDGDGLWPGVCPRRTGFVGRRHGGDEDYAPGVWPGACPRRTESSAPSFFSLLPAARIVEDILGPLVVFELIADDAVHESRIPKAHFFALDTLVYATCDGCFE